MIWLCVKRTSNVHKDRTENIGISKHEKHLQLLSSGTKLFITFEFKGFFDIRRERHNLSILAFSSGPHLMRHPAQGLCESQPSRPVSSLNSTNFLQIPKNPLCASGA